MGRNMPLGMIGSLVAGEASSWLARTRRKVLFMALAGLLALTAYVLLVTAGVTALAESYGTPIAALVAAGAMIATAIIVVAILRFIEWQQRRKYRERRQSRKALLATAAAVALPSLIRSKPLLLLAILGGGGLLASGVLSEGDEEV